MADNASTELLTIPELCKYARISVRLYARMRLRHEGPAETRLGRRVFISRQAMLTWLRAREQPSAAAACGDGEEGR